MSSPPYSNMKKINNGGNSGKGYKHTIHGGEITNASKRGNARFGRNEGKTR